MLSRNFLKRLLLTVLIVPAICFATDKIVYEATWESLDKRPIAPWFEDAKFGIFIHWGPYSVPAYTPVGSYAEWYQLWLTERSFFGNSDKPEDFIYTEHKRIYGEDYSYYNFANDFKAELWDPEEWVQIFERAGARYVIMTSKHHDGFALWPNQHANDRGFPWNSMEVGSKRDLVGELTNAFRKSDLKFGLYYSLWEWYHPKFNPHREKDNLKNTLTSQEFGDKNLKNIWTDGKETFNWASQHMFPQFKELITQYKPDIVWPDGQWHMPEEEFNQKELLAWLFNESPIADTVVINDRWAKGSRFKHGGYYTNEYDAGGNYAKPWEEIRGLGFSFGYNRAENAADYNDTQTFILMLADVVSAGGNLCLNVGPRADGKIPPIVEYHLLKIGKWLSRNGEAIYGTRKWTLPVQWGPGKQNYEPYFKSIYPVYTGGDYIIRQTLNVPEGYAKKEAFFTRKGNDIYVILPKWHNTFTLRNVKLSSRTTAILLATNQSVSLHQDGDHVILRLPDYDPNVFRPEDAYAYVVKLVDAIQK